MARTNTRCSPAVERIGDQDCWSLQSSIVTMSPISENVNGSNGTTRCAKLNVPLWINGKEETRSDTFNVVTPYTNDVCWTAAAGTPEDGIKAVEAAEAAFPAWSQTKPTVRRDILLKAADLLESQLEELAQIMRTEMGADVGTSQFFVTPLAIRMLRDIAGRITSICGSVPVVEAEGQSAIVYKEPMGIILGIVPWCVDLHTRAHSRDS